MWPLGGTACEYRYGLGHTRLDALLVESVMTFGSFTLGLVGIQAMMVLLRRCLKFGVSSSLWLCEITFMWRFKLVGRRYEDNVSWFEATDA